MSTSMTSDGSEVIHRRLQPLDYNLPKPVDLTSGEDLDNFYELDRGEKWIKDNSFQRVCIQLPDPYLKDSVYIMTRLETSTGQRVVLLADSTYGSCCVDEKTAQHADGDCIIHFGPSCLAATGRLPVLYIFTRPLNLNLELALQTFESNFKDENATIVILFDVIFEYFAGDLYAHLSKKYPNAILSSLVVPGRGGVKPSQNTDDCSKYPIILGRRIPPDTPGQQVFYIGTNQRTLINIMLSLPNSSFHIYDPTRGDLQLKSSEISKLLMRRNYFVEKIKDCQFVGILIATLAVKDYLSIIAIVKTTLKSMGKTVYTVSIGEITPPKLANFPDIEAFVLIACPECTIFDSKDFFQPIVTPFEVELAFNQGREWDGKYAYDFRVLLPGGDLYVPLTISESADVSLITGGMRVLNNWQGLDLTEVGSQKIEDGRTGIPSHYQDEPETES